MQKFILFFIIIGATGFIYFSYINVISKSMKNQGQAAPTKTQQILEEQSSEIKRLNQDYHSIIEDNKRQTQQPYQQQDNEAIKRDQAQTLKNNQRQIEENRRQMEQLRRNLQRR